MIDVVGDSGTRWRETGGGARRGASARVLQVTGEDGRTAAMKIAEVPGRPGAWVEGEGILQHAASCDPGAGPFVAPAHDTGTVDGAFFRVSDWFEETLEDRVSRAPSVEARFALARALVLAALACRDAGVPPRRLHPRNAFVLEDAKVPRVLLDDLAGERPPLGPVSTTSSLTGLRYFAPELLVGVAPGDEAFGVAACVFLCLTGQPPEAPSANLMRLTPLGRRWIAGQAPAPALSAVLDLRDAPALTPRDRAALRVVASPALIEACDGLLAPDPTRRERDFGVLLPLLSPCRRMPRRLPWVVAGVLGVGVFAATRPIPPVPARYALLPISAGTFRMGAGTKAPGPDESPHTVSVRAFQLGAHEVDQALWTVVTGENPVETAMRSYGGVRSGACRSYDGQDLVDPRYPVLCVSWFDVVRFANLLSAREGLDAAYTIEGDGAQTQVTWRRDADGYRLPTEAEWEYAARAGTTDPYAGSPDLDALCRAANTRATRCHDGAPGLLRVGSLAANAWGLYDMTGNIQEWVWDVYGAYEGDAVDPLGATSGVARVNRGGSWFRVPRTVAWRSADVPTTAAPTVGVRLARSGVP